MNGYTNGVGLTLLTRPGAAEASLWRRLRFEGQAACRERLFNLYRDLARMIAVGEFRRRPSHGLELGDFHHLALSGLLEAIDRFDPERGAPFEAFARRRLRGAISDGLARSSETGAQYSHQRKAERDRLNSLQAGAPASTGDYVADLADLANSLAIGIIAENARTHAPDEALGQGLEAYESIAWREMELAVLDEIERLPRAERSVIEQHYLHGVPFTQIADLLGVSKGRVSQLHRAAIVCVRERLRRRD